MDFVQQTIMLKFVVGIIVSQRLFSLISTFLADSGVPPPLRYVVYAVIFASGMLGAMWHYQEDILYRPEVPAGMGGSIKTIDDNPSGMRSPAEHGMAFEETRLVAADGVETMHGSCLRLETPGLHQLCYSRTSNMGLASRVQDVAVGLVATS